MHSTASGALLVEHINTIRTNSVKGRPGRVDELQHLLCEGIINWRGWRKRWRVALCHGYGAAGLMRKMPDRFMPAVILREAFSSGRPANEAQVKPQEDTGAW